MAQDNRPQARQSTLGKYISRLITVIVWLLFALLMSIISEWIGMNFYWQEEGVRHSQQMVNEELKYLNEDFRKSLVVRKPVEYAKSFAGATNKYLFEKTGIMDYIIKTFKNTVAGDSARIVADHLLAAIYITQVFAIRLAILTLALPAFFIFATVAAVEGLVQRDIRKWSVGREHAGLYHHTKRFIPMFLIAPWVIYLAVPFSVHPNFIILPFAILFGMGIFMVTYLFKKHI